MKYLKNHLLCLFCLLTVFLCFGCQQPETVNPATTGSISGKVVYWGVDVADAQIYISGTNYCAFSDSNGKFVLSGIPAGENYSVIVSYQEEKKRIDQVSVAVNEETELGEIVVERNNAKSLLKEVFSTDEGIFFVVGDSDSEATALEISGAGLTCYIDCEYGDEDENERYLLPYVEKEKSYIFDVKEYFDNKVQREERFSICAEGGLGEFKILNEEKINLQIVQGEKEGYSLKMDELPEVNLKYKNSFAPDMFSYQFNVRADKKISLKNDYFCTSSNKEVLLSEKEFRTSCDYIYGELRGSSIPGEAFEDVLKGRDFKVKAFLLFEYKTKGIIFRKDFASAVESNKDESVKVEIKPLTEEFLGYLDSKEKYYRTNFGILRDFLDEGAEYPDYYKGRKFENGVVLSDYPETFEIKLPEKPSLELELFARYLKVEDWVLYGVHRTDGKIDGCTYMYSYSPLCLNMDCRGELVTEYYLVPDFSVVAEVPVDSLGGFPRRTVARCELLFDDVIDTLMNWTCPELNNEGYFYENFFTDKKCLNPVELSDLLNENLVLYPDWQKIINVTVYFKDDGERTIKTKKCTYSDLYKKITENSGTNDGENWFFYTDSEYHNPINIREEKWISEDTSIYARIGRLGPVDVYFMGMNSWVELYCGISYSENKQLFTGDLFERFIVDGSRFFGAYLDPEMQKKLEDDTVINEGCVIYLDVRPLPVIELVDIHFGDHRCINNFQYDYGTGYEWILKDLNSVSQNYYGKHEPEREFFKGWYLDPLGETPLSNNFVLEEDTIIYMIWKPLNVLVSVYCENWDYYEDMEFGKYVANGYTYKKGDEKLFTPDVISYGYSIEGFYFDPEFLDPLEYGYCFEDNTSLFIKLIPPVTIRLGMVLDGKLSQLGSVEATKGSWYSTDCMDFYGIYNQLNIEVQKKTPVGFVFAGLYTDPLGFDAVDNTFVVDGNVTILYVFFEPEYLWGDPGTDPWVDPGKEDDSDDEPWVDPGKGDDSDDEPWIDPGIEDGYDDDFWGEEKPYSGKK